MVAGALVLVAAAIAIAVVELTGSQPARARVPRSRLRRRDRPGHEHDRRPDSSRIYTDPDRFRTRRRLGGQRAGQDGHAHRSDGKDGLPDDRRRRAADRRRRRRGRRVAARLGLHRPGARRAPGPRGARRAERLRRRLQGSARLGPFGFGAGDSLAAGDGAVWVAIPSLGSPSRGSMPPRIGPDRRSTSRGCPGRGTRGWAEVDRKSRSQRARYGSPARSVSSGSTGAPTRSRRPFPSTWAYRLGLLPGRARSGSSRGLRSSVVRSRRSARAP